MNKSPLFIILIVLLCLSIVSANTYQIEYTQVENKVVIKEIVDDIQISNYVSKDLFDKSSEGYYFVEKINFNQSYDSVVIKLNLDTGFIFDKESIFPSGYKIESDGQIISAIWQLQDIKKEDSFPMFVKIKNTENNFTEYLLILFIILIIGFTIYKGKNKASKRKEVRHSKKTIKQKKETDYDYLLDTEKRIIEELKKADRNELWQKQIQLSTGFSKAKVSRLVRNLEARNLVTKIPFGNTNKVRLR